MNHDEANPRGSWAPRCGTASRYGRDTHVSVPERQLPIDCPVCVALARRQVEWFAAGQPSPRADRYVYAPIMFRDDASKVLGGIALAGILEAVGIA